MAGRGKISQEVSADSFAAGENYILHDGERRVRAARLAGTPTPARIFRQWRHEYEWIKSLVPRLRCRGQIRRRIIK